MKNIIEKPITFGKRVMFWATKKALGNKLTIGGKNLSNNPPESNEDNSTKQYVIPGNQEDPIITVTRMSAEAIEKSAKSAKHTSYATYALFGATLLLAFGAIVNLIQTNNLISNEKDVLETQELELDRFEQQLDQNQQILDTYYRPWIAVSVTSFVPDNTKNTFVIDYEVKNYGSIPAKNVRVYNIWTIDKTHFFVYSEERADFIKTTSDEPWVATMVSAGQSSNVHVPDPWKYQQERFQDIINGDELLGIEFLILYDDISGDEHWSYLGIAYDFLTTDDFVILSSDGN
ncbi:MAG: hypothetical protein HOC20_13840 [Chloroflexi bacterium]|nr:hypothetical protein [Chloroflexota bacterium]